MSFRHRKPHMQIKSFFTPDHIDIEPANQGLGSPHGQEMRYAVHREEPVA